MAVVALALVALALEVSVPFAELVVSDEEVVVDSEEEELDDEAPLFLGK